MALVPSFVAMIAQDKGIGGSLLRDLESEALQHGVRFLLAHVSSRHSRGLVSCRTHILVKCGPFRGIGTKQGKPFDVVWSEKALVEAP